MIRILLNTSADLIRMIRRWLFRFILVVGLITLNIATVLSYQVYDTVSNLVWDIAQILLPDGKQRPKNFAELEDELSTTRKERADIDAERSKVEEKTKRLETELETSKRRRASLDEELGHLRSEHRELKEASESAKIAEKKLQRQMAEILRTMRSRTAKTMERNLGSNIMDMIPGWGTITVVGMVGWDVYDACQQMKDVQSLQELYLDTVTDGSVEETKYCGLSQADLIAHFTGQDPNFARCVDARLRTHSLDPPECEDFPNPLLPSPPVDDSPTRPPSSPTP